MEEEWKPVLAFKGGWRRTPGFLGQAAPAGHEHQLEISVVFTSAPATLAALRHAGALADCLGARVTLLAPQIVPFPRPLDNPPVQSDFVARQFEQMGAASRVDTAVQIYLCRDWQDTLEAILKPNSLVVVGGTRRWWFSPEKRLAARLRRAGHQVVFKQWGDK